MKTEDFKTESLEILTNSIQEKLGKETSATINDKLAEIVTFNSGAYELLKSKDEEIAKKDKRIEELTSANANLYLQIPRGNSYDSREVPEEETKTSFNLRDAFDERGRFKK